MIVRIGFAEVFLSGGALRFAATWLQRPFGEWSVVGVAGDQPDATPVRLPDRRLGCPRLASS